MKRFHSLQIEELLVGGGGRGEQDKGGNGEEVVEYGSEACRVLFATFAASEENSELTFLNHGAFGNASMTAVIAAEQARRKMEYQPLTFLDRLLFPLLTASVNALSPMIGADPKDVVLLPNATAGLNASISSLLPHRQKEDPEAKEVLCFNTTYGSVAKMLEQACAEGRGWRMVTHDILLPVRGHWSDIVNGVRETLEKNQRIAVAVIDHVSSNTGMVFPVKELCALCRKHGVMTIIDGAHALGMLPALDVPSIDCDVYVGNCHKWFCSPKGVGFMWARVKMQKHLQPKIISHGFGAGFQSAFMWDGCRDYSSMVSIAVLPEWWDRRLGGIDNATAYSRKLCSTAASFLSQSWGTDCLLPPEMMGNMALVRLPRNCSRSEKWSGEGTEEDAHTLQDWLHQQKITVPVKVIPHTVDNPSLVCTIGGGCSWERGHLYVRISTHVYNRLQDYETLSVAILNYLPNH